MPYNPGSGEDRDLVRLRITDRGPEYIFDDSELDDMLAVEGDWRGAAALALETIATSEALTQKVIRILELQTDGAKLADSLLKQAQTIRSQTDFGDSFDWAEMILTSFQREEYAIREWVNA